MGDADVAIGLGIGNRAEEVEEALFDLHDNLNTLQLNLTELTERTMRQLHSHMVAYMSFRYFVIAINFAFIPVLLAMGLSYLLTEVIDIESKDSLQDIIASLWFIAASIGLPLYIGSIWAIYNLPTPEDIPDEELSGLPIEEFDFNDVFIQRLNAAFPREFAVEAEDEAEDIEVPENQRDDTDGNETEGEGEASVNLLTDQERLENDMDLPAEMQPARESSAMNSTAVTEEQDLTIYKNDNIPQVDGESVVPATAVTVASTLPDNF